MRLGRAHERRKGSDEEVQSDGVSELDARGTVIAQVVIGIKRLTLEHLHIAQVEVDRVRVTGKVEDTPPSIVPLFGVSVAGSV